MTTTETATATKLVIKPEEFAHKAANVALFASSDQARPILTAVLVEMTGQGQGRMVATDSYGLCVEEFTTDSNVSEGTWLVPAKMLAEVAKQASKTKSPVVFTFDNWTVTAECDRQTVTDRLVDGQFPNWKQLMPDESKLTGCAVFGVGSKMLARIAKMKTERGPVGISGEAIKVLCPADATKPFLMKVGSATVLQMPLRLP